MAVGEGGGAVGGPKIQENQLDDGEVRECCCCGCCCCLCFSNCKATPGAESFMHVSPKTHQTLQLKHVIVITVFPQSRIILGSHNTVK
jgi:hypothetical protein